jgi:hypothetical protein
MLRPEKQNYALGFGISKQNGVIEFSHGGTDAGFQARLSAAVDGRGLTRLRLRPTRCIGVSFRG